MIQSKLQAESQCAFLSMLSFHFSNSDILHSSDASSHLKLKRKKSPYRSQRNCLQKPSCLWFIFKRLAFTVPWWRLCRNMIPTSNKSSSVIHFRVNIWYEKWKRLALGLRIPLGPSLWKCLEETNRFWLLTQMQIHSKIKRTIDPNDFWLGFSSWEWNGVELFDKLNLIPMLSEKRWSESPFPPFWKSSFILCNSWEFEILNSWELNGDTEMGYLEKSMLDILLSLPWLLITKLQVEKQEQRIQCSLWETQQKCITTKKVMKNTSYRVANYWCNKRCSSDCCTVLEISRKLLPSFYYIIFQDFFRFFVCLVWYPMRAGAGTRTGAGARTGAGTGARTMLLMLLMYFNSLLTITCYISTWPHLQVIFFFPGTICTRAPHFLQVTGPVYSGTDDHHRTW